MRQPQMQILSLKCDPAWNTDTLNSSPPARKWSSKSFPYWCLKYQRSTKQTILEKWTGMNRTRKNWFLGNRWLFLPNICPFFKILYSCFTFVKGRKSVRGETVRKRFPISYLPRYLQQLGLTNLKPNAWHSNYSNLMYHRVPSTRTIISCPLVYISRELYLKQSILGLNWHCVWMQTFQAMTCIHFVNSIPLKYK